MKSNLIFITICSALLSFYYSANSQQNFALYPHAPAETFSTLRCVEENSSGKKWMAYSPVSPGFMPTNNGSLDYFDGTTWVNHDFSNSSFYGFSYALVVDSNDIAWIGTDSGLVKFDGATFTRFSKGNSTLPGNFIQDICIDQQGNKWMICSDSINSIHSNYIVKYDGNSFTTYSYAQTGIYATFAENDMMEHRKMMIDCYQNNIYVKFDSIYSNSTGSKIFRFDQTTWTNLNAPPQRDMQFDGNGNLWASAGNNFYKYNGSNWITYSFDDSLLTGFSSTFGFIIDKKTNAFYTYGSDLYTFYVRAFHNFNFSFFDSYSVNYPPYVSGITFGKWNSQRNFMWLYYTNGIVSQAGKFAEFDENGIGHFSGNVYDDLNSNGIKDAGDTGISNRMINISSNGLNWTDISRSNGDYMISFTDSTANYAITTTTPLYWTITSSPSVYNLSPLTNASCCYDFGIAPQPGHVDVRCFLNGCPVTRPGWNFNLTINYENIGTVVMNDIITLNLDPQSNYVSAVPVPDVITPGQLQWSYSNLQSMEQRIITVTLLAATTLTSGDTLHFTALIAPLAGDENIENNAAAFDVAVLTSFDPNIKTVEPANAVSPAYISSGNGWFNYTIHFQNTGTAPAQFIIINDSINTGLDLSSLEITGYSFPVNAELKYPRLLRFSCDNIWLPDSNVNEPASHGFVSYRIKALPTLTINDTISNTALIYFDFNPAVITNTTLNFIDPVLNFFAERKYWK